MTEAERKQHEEWHRKAEAKREAAREAELARYPVMGGMFIAVFNCREHDQTKGRKAVLDKFGAAAWKRVLACKRTGIMEIFHHPQTPELLLYAQTVADCAEARAAKRRARALTHQH